MTAAKTNNNLPSWADAGLQGATFLLTVVKDAFQYAPIPYVQQAAGSALFIVNTIGTVKNNKEDFHRLANDAITLVAVIWRAYQKADRKEEWPARALRDVILEFCSILHSIEAFAKDRGSRKWMYRTVYSSLDRQKIMEYRERLTSAVQTFQVAADLDVNEMVSEMLEKQNRMMDRIEYSTNLLEMHVLAGNSRPSRQEEWPEQRPNHERPYPPARWDDTPSGSANGNASRPPNMPVSFTNIQYSGISFGDGSVTVTNGGS